MDEVLAQAQQLLGKMSDIFFQTLESELEHLIDFEEQATSTISNALTEVHNKLTELAKSSEVVRDCLMKKEAEMQEIKTQMKKKLVECYKKYYGPLDTLRDERAKIHESARQLKLEAQKAVEDCMKTEQPLQCFQRSLADMREKAEALLKTFEAHVEKESEVRAKSAKLIQECNLNVIAESRREYSRVLEDIKKCGQ